MDSRLLQIAIDLDKIFGSQRPTHFICQIKLSLIIAPNITLIV